MKKKLQVFISSTYTDLQNERQAAVEAILKSGNIPAGMELFTAGNESQMQTIIRWIDESDVLMLILGGRYGSIEESSGLSYTELEYDYAISSNIATFAVVIEEEALDRKVKDHGKEVLERQNVQKLEEFRKKVLGNISTFFREDKDIKLAVHETLADFKERKQFSGWVSGRDVEGLSVLAEEANKLRAENAQLIELIEKDKSKTQPSSAEDDDADLPELLKILSSMRLSTKVLEDLKEEKEYSVAEVLLMARNSLVTGLHNSAGMSPTAKFLFFNVLPKLAVHGLAERERVAGAKYQRFVLSSKGLRLLAYIDRRTFEGDGSPKTS